MKPLAPFLAIALLLSPAVAPAADWFPTQWASEDTLQYRTDCPGEGEHWSYVWLVVLDGEIWVRLGSKAAGRVDCSTTKPMTTIRLGGHEFPDIEMINVPEMADRVAAAMGEKYLSDIFIRYADHPYTMKLVPKSAAVADAAGQPVAEKVEEKANEPATAEDGEAADPETPTSAPAEAP